MGSGGGPAALSPVAPLGEGRGGGGGGGGGIEVLLGGLQGGGAGVDVVVLREAIPPHPEPRGREEKWMGVGEECEENR
jgi:hypothetical protein